MLIDRFFCFLRLQNAHEKIQNLSALTSAAKQKTAAGERRHKSLFPAESPEKSKREKEKFFSGLIMR